MLKGKTSCTPLSVFALMAGNCLAQNEKGKDDQQKCLPPRLRCERG
jgi:hypothetical protein